MLDLYAGSGAMGFEALSRGAAHCTFVDSQKAALASIRKNIEELEVAPQTAVIPLDAAVAIKRLSEPFDLVYIDPPYDLPISPIMDLLLSKKILKEGAIVFIEERYTPKQKTAAYSSPHLLLKSSRRFGTALLHHYIVL